MWSNNLPLDIIEEVEDPTAAEEEMFLNLEEYFSVDVVERLLSNFCTNSDDGEEDEVFGGGGQWTIFPSSEMKCWQL